MKENLNDVILSHFTAQCKINYAFINNSIMHCTTLVILTLTHLCYVINTDDILFYNNIMLRS